MEQETFEKEKVKIMSNGYPKDLAKVAIPVGASAVSFVVTDYLSNSLTLTVVIPSLVMIIYILTWLISEINKSTKREKTIEDLNKQILQNSLVLSDSFRNYQDFQKYLGKKQSERLKFGETEIYLSYKNLDIFFLEEFLHLYNKLYTIFFSIYTDEETFLEKKSLDYSQKIFKLHPEDILVIRSIHTGESIKLKISPRWIPHFSHDDDNFYIHVHKGVYLTIFTSSIILASLKFAVDITNGVIDLSKKLNHDEMEKARQEIHYNPKYENVEINIDKTYYIMDKKFQELPNDIKDQINNDLRKLRSITVDNDSIKEIKISNYPIKPE